MTINPERFDVDLKKVRAVLDNARKEGRTHILEDEGYEILSAYGFNIPKSVLASTEDECVKATKKVGYPCCYTNIQEQEDQELQKK
jgi:4-hydroxybutyrate---CoA ligase (ADP-forming)